MNIIGTYIFIGDWYMEDLPFRVELKESGKKKGEEGSGSLRFTIPADIIRTIGLQKEDFVYVTIWGIFPNKSATEPLRVEIPLPSKLITTGRTSLGITVDKKIVDRYDLKKDMELEISLKVIKKAS